MDITENTTGHLSEDNITEDNIVLMQINNFSESKRCVL